LLHRKADAQRQVGLAREAPAANTRESPVQVESATALRLIQRREQAAVEESAEPTEAQKAAALAAAAQAERIASQAAAAGNAEIAKSKRKQAQENQTKQAAGQKAQSASGAAEQSKKTARQKKKRPRGPAIQERPAAEEEAGAAGQPGPAKAPSSPEEDPAFQAVVKRVAGVAGKQRAHAPAESKAAEAQAAAEAPKEEITGRAQETKAGEMETVQPPPFDAAGFKARLFKRIGELAPKTLEEADNFKKNNKLGGVKEEMQGEVGEGKAASKGPLEAKSKEPPNTEAVEPKPVTAIPEPAPGAPPAGVGGAAAAPKLKTKDEIEAPVQENTARIGGELAKEDITEEQLAKSNEPQFQEALGAKRQAEAQAAQAPQNYRQFEDAKLSSAGAQAAGTAAARTQGMYAGRAEIFGQVHQIQGQAKSRDEAARLKVGQDIDKIYRDTQTAVDTVLSELDGKVETAFDEGAAAARKAFQEYVDARMEAYKQKRYGGWLGWARWAKDKLAGMPDEVNVFYERGRELYLQKMSAVIDNVVAIIGAELTRAKAEVANGRKKIAEYLAKLPDDLRTVGAEAAGNALSMFDSLEQQVNDKQDSLIDTLANKYQENLKAVDARIQEMKEANRGLVDKAIDAVKAVVNTIIELKNMMKRVLARIADVVSLIIRDPIGFFGKLIAGLKQGFDNFVAGIWNYLKAGFIGWLTGALGSAGLQVPEDVFRVKGMFSILMQVLGLTWNFIRAKAVKLLGEPAMKVLETAFTPFQVLIREGPAGLWEFAKEKFADLKEMLVEQIKDMLVVQVIKAGIKWILGLLNPVSAFIKAAIAIYDIVMFFVQKARQIGEFIESLIDAVAEIAKGNIAAAAKKVEGSLARALPLIIGLLASLLGLGGLAQKVQRLFTSLRKRVDGFIDGLILKAKKVAGNLLKRFRRGKKEERAADKGPDKALQDTGAPPVGHRMPIPVEGGETHYLFIEVRNGRPLVYVRSAKTVLQSFLESDAVEALRSRPHGPEHLSTARRQLAAVSVGAAEVVALATQPRRQARVSDANSQVTRAEQMLVVSLRWIFGQLQGGGAQLSRDVITDSINTEDRRTDKLLEIVAFDPDRLPTQLKNLRILRSRLEALRAEVRSPMPNELPKVRQKVENDLGAIRAEIEGYEHDPAIVDNRTRLEAVRRGLEAEAATSPGASAWRQIRDEMQQVLAKYKANILSIAPGSRVGFRGSLARGWKGPHKTTPGGAAQEFTARDFDCDAYIEIPADMWVSEIAILPKSKNARPDRFVPIEELRGDWARAAELLAIVQNIQDDIEKSRGPLRQMRLDRDTKRPEFHMYIQSPDVTLDLLLQAAEYPKGAFEQAGRPTIESLLPLRKGRRRYPQVVVEV
jgi:hypothetical protein